MSISGPPRSVLAWHVHGSWMESFVAGPHRYLLPVTPNGRGLFGRHRPDATEAPVDQLGDNDFGDTRTSDPSPGMSPVEVMYPGTPGVVSAEDCAQNRCGLDRFLSDGEDLIESICR